MTPAALAALKALAEGATKTCSSCAVTKPLELYWRNQAQPDGRSYYCIECERVAKKARGKKPDPWARERNTWRNMVARCLDSKHAMFRLYGARGITVCERWLSFNNFLADMGLRPEGMTIDRIDSDGHYEPGNCRWATAQEQRSNRRDVRLLAWMGEELSAAAWSRRLGLRPKTVSERLRKGWSIERALTTRGEP